MKFFRSSAMIMQIPSSLPSVRSHGFLRSLFLARDVLGCLECPPMWEVYNTKPGVRMEFFTQPAQTGSDQRIDHEPRNVCFAEGRPPAHIADSPKRTRLRTARTPVLSHWSSRYLYRIQVKRRGKGAYGAASASPTSSLQRAASLTATSIWTMAKISCPAVNPEF